jgi:uncharacterized membrane protein
MKSNKMGIRLALGLIGLFLFFRILVTNFASGRSPNGVFGWIWAFILLIISLIMLLMGLGIIKTEIIEKIWQNFKTGTGGRRDQPKMNYFISVMIGGVIGSICMIFGWWLYSGSTNGDFTCSVSFIPCSIIGLLIMVIGAGMAVVGLTGKLKSK